MLQRGLALGVEGETVELSLLLAAGWGEFGGKVCFPLRVGVLSPPLTPLRVQAEPCCRAGLGHPRRKTSRKNPGRGEKGRANVEILLKCFCKGCCELRAEPHAAECDYGRLEGSYRVGTRR